MTRNHVIEIDRNDRYHCLTEISSSSNVLDLVPSDPTYPSQTGTVDESLSIDNEDRHIGEQAIRDVRPHTSEQYEAHHEHRLGPVAKDIWKAWQAHKREYHDGAEATADGTALEQSAP